MRVDPRVPLALSGLAGLGVGAQGPWWTIAWDGTFGAAGSMGLTGGAGTGGLAGVLPAVALAAVLATLTLRTPGRRAVGVVAALAGAGMAVLGLSSPMPNREVVEQAVRAATLSTDLAVTPTGLAMAYGGLGLLVAVCSVWLVARPPAARRRPDDRGATDELADSLSSWKAMDEGRDPTRAEGGRS